MSNKSILYIQYSNIIHSQWKGSFTTKTFRLKFVNVESLVCDGIGVEWSLTKLRNGVIDWNFLELWCWLGKPSLKKKKKCDIFHIRVWPPPPLFCVKCDEKLIYFLSIIRAYLGHIEPIKIFYPQNHLKKYEKSAKI